MLGASRRAMERSNVSDAISDGPADLVLTGGAVYTVDAARPWAQDVAVKDGRIVAVGTDGSVADLIGPKTEVHDLDGRMLLPGFQDAHVHPPSGALEMLECNLNEAYTRGGHGPGGHADAPGHGGGMEGGPPGGPAILALARHHGVAGRHRRGAVRHARRIHRDGRQR